MNEELNVVNIKLQSTNLDLSESNQIKEVYIGKFLKLCSTYIDKLDEFRRMVNKKIVNDKIPELLNYTKPQDTLDDVFQELYINFDDAFLRIFPDFVDRVNELFYEDQQIILKKDGVLNTELRILALVRLGISDSSQIADFLRYSVITIYNNRTKLRNREIISKPILCLLNKWYYPFFQSVFVNDTIPCKLTTFIKNLILEYYSRFTSKSSLKITIVMFLTKNTPLLE